MTVLLRLCYEFFKTGLFAIGGGLATIPFLRDMAEKTGWFTLSDLSDMIAVSESTPGPVGINMATYTGYKVAGVPGGILATLSLVFPSVVIIIIVSKLLNRFRNSSTVQGIMYGIRPASVAMICSACILVAVLAFYEGGVVNFKGIVLAAAILVLYLKFKWHPIFYIIGAAVIGIVFKF